MGLGEGKKGEAAEAVLLSLHQKIMPSSGAVIAVTASVARTVALITSQVRAATLNRMQSVVSAMPEG